MSRRVQGFTIVELLIVVVVIAILAAITIVSYNGITNRSRAAAAQTAAEQAAKKVLVYAAVNSDLYPASLTDAGVSDGSATYQYRADNVATPKTFCVTATTQNISYWVSSTSSKPSAGACAGHAADGGETVTNLFLDPSFEGGTLPAVENGATATVDTSTKRSSDRSILVTTTTAGHSRVRYNPPTTGLTAGVEYTVSAWVYSPYAARLAFEVAGQVDGYDIPAAAWTRITKTRVASNSYIYLGNHNAVSGSQTAKSFYVDDVMVTAGTSQPAFGWGESTGWLWNGPSNNSTSTGPTL